MSRRKRRQPFVWTYIAVAFAVALAIYVYVSRPAESPGTPVFLDLDYNTIDRIVINRGDETLVLKLEDGNWLLLAGVSRFDTDKLAVTSMLTALSDLQITREVAAGVSESDMNRYGLSSPAITVTADSRDARAVIRFGDRTPVGQERYIAVNAKPDAIYTVDDSSFDVFNREHDDIRSREVVPIMPWKLIEVSIANSRQTTRAVRCGDEWTITSPFEDLADGYAVSNLGWTASGLRADEFVDDEPSKLAPYGLDPPRATAVFTSEDKEPSISVYIGSDAEGGKGFYFMTDRSRSVYRSNQYATPFVDLEAGSLLQTSIATRTRAELAGFDVLVNGQSYTVQAQGDRWNVKLPSGEAVSLTGPEAAGAWYELLQVKVDGIAPVEYQTLDDYELGIASTDTGLEIRWIDGSKTTALYGSTPLIGELGQALVPCRISDRGHVYAGDPADLQAMIRMISGTQNSEP